MMVTNNYDSLDMMNDMINECYSIVYIDAVCSLVISNESCRSNAFFGLCCSSLS